MEKLGDGTLGNPFACVPIIVTSPSLGFGLSNGTYCFIARCRTASCDSAVARAYSRICWHSRVCSLISKVEFRIVKYKSCGVSN